jgi:hypothetical protein
MDDEEKTEDQKNERASKSEPQRLDNVSIFPSPVVSGGDPFPDYPDLPDFLDRRKAKHQAAAA